MAMLSVLIASISFCSAAAVHLTPVSESTWDDQYFKNVPQDLGRPVFYSIVMGKLTKRNQVNTVVGSLRQVGKWMGPIMIVTDSPICISKKLVQAGLIQEKIASDLDVDIFSSSVPPSTGGGGNRTPSGKKQSSGNVDVDIYESFSGTVHIVHVPPPFTSSTYSNILSMKRQKMQAWRHVGQAKIPDVSHIIYMDEDVVVGSGLDEFMHEVSRSDREHTLALFDDKGTERGEPHTGVVVMSPFAASMDCLGSWSKSLGGSDIVKSTGISDLEGPDQQALMHNAQCNSWAGLKILNTKYLLMPTVETLRAGTTSTFVHFTNQYRWKLIPGSEKEYWMYHVLGLSRALDVLAYDSCAEQ